MRRTALLAIVWIVLGGTACSGADDSVLALGTLERDRLELTAEAHEPIVAMQVREGERVVAGQILARLDTASIGKQLQSAAANASAAEHRLLELTRGPRRESILEAQARLEGARSSLANETREARRLQDLVRQRLISQSAADQQEAAQERAAAQLKEAQAQLSVLLKGTRIEELDQARDALEQAKAELERLQITAQRMTVRAPRAGVVEALPYKLGERPPAGAPVVVMLADGETFARVYVPAQLRNRVQPGVAARIHVDGEEEAIAGRVRYVASEAAFTPYYALTQEDRGRLSYLAEVTLTGERAAQLPAGIPVEVSFPVARTAAAAEGGSRP